MFPYDAQLLANLQTPPTSVPEVLAIMQAIDALTVDGDGLHWFNWLYYQVTQAVENRINAGGFADAVFLAELDVQFAQLYFNALKAHLSGHGLPGCWQTLFERRNQTQLARIQFALAGINAHINHDLPAAIVATCAVTNITPQHNTTQYDDYTSLNPTLDSMIEAAKTSLNVRLLGDLMPPVSALENNIAAWSVSAAREAAWQGSEILWHLRSVSFLENGYMNSLDGLTTVVSKGLLIPIP